MRIGTVALVIIMACAIATAEPTLNAASGCVQLPNAEVAKAGGINVAVDFINSTGINELSQLGFYAPCQGNGFNARTTVGFGSSLEVGLGYLGVFKEIGTANALTVGAKYKFYEDPGNSLSFAIGATYRDWDADMSVFEMYSFIDFNLPTVTSAYIAMDKTFGVPADCEYTTVVTLGLMFDHYAAAQQTIKYMPIGVQSTRAYAIDEGGEVENAEFFSPFIAFKTTNGNWSLKGEYKPELRKDHFTFSSDVWSIAVSKRVTPNLTATLGLTNFNLPYSDSNAGLFFGLSAALGK
jgi:hypothetical protein